MPLTLAKQRYTDKTLDRFVKTNMYYVTDKYIRFQDPVYMGFKLFFLFDQADSGLLNTREDHQNTAYAYLKRIGEDVRAEYLKKFVEHLRKINLVTPWFWQTIDGLGDAWKHGYSDDAFKALLPKDRKIKIGCLDESVDLRITALMDLYRKACFDWPNRREIVPQNLRYFKVGIYCYEAREINRRGYPGSVGLLDFQTLLGLPDVNESQQEATRALLGEDPRGGRPIDSRAAIKGAATSFGKDPVQGIKDILSRNDSQDTEDSPNPNISRVMFNFGFCEFLPDESGVFFDGMSNKEMKLAAQNVTFSYRTVYEDNVFNVYSPDKKLSDLVTLYVDSAALDNPNIAPNPKFAEGYGILDANNPVANAIAPFASLAADKIERLLSSYAGKLLMGNIYGFSVMDAAQTAQALLSGDPVQQAAAAQKTVRKAFDNKSLNNQTEKRSAAQLFFDIVTPNQLKKINGEKMAFEESTSISNKSESSSAKTQTVGNSEASAFNSSGSNSANSQSVGNPEASIANSSGSNPANSQTVGNANASTANDNGPDSKPQTTANPNASLSNNTKSL
jgi:hypothetical protein